MFFGLIAHHPRPRYVPARPLPAYRHDPGITPHPEKDPRGHSYGLELCVDRRLDPESPRDCEAYLWGFDLFNHGYFWEAHAAWEALWVAEERTGDVGDLLKGLIRLAAASVKARNLENVAARGLFESGAEVLEELHARLGRKVFADIHLPELIQHARSVAQAVPERGPHPDFLGEQFAWSLRPGDPRGTGRQPTHRD